MIFLYSKFDDESVLLGNFDEDMIEKANVMFDWSRETNEEKIRENVRMCVKRVKTCLKKRNLVRQ